MSRAVLGVARAPRIGLVPTKQRPAPAGHIPSATSIIAAHRRWKSRLPITCASYYDCPLVGSRNGGTR